MDLKDEKKLKELKKILLLKGYTQQRLADELGVSRQTINNLLRGASPFGMNTAKRWAEILGIRVGWLMTGEGDPYAQPEPKEPIDPDLLAVVNRLLDINEQHAQNLGRLIDKISDGMA